MPDGTQIAIHRTGNPYGITVGGTPYLEPFVGMKVETWHGEGVILQIRKPLARGGDPEVQIMTSDGRKVYLFQTALDGYSIRKEL